jgi:heptosyltransferase III
VTALVIHPGALGDVLLSVPALRVLRAGGTTITLAAQPRIGALLVALGIADAATAFDTLGLDTLFTDAPLAADAPLIRRLRAASQVVCWFGARDADFTRRLRVLAPSAVVAPPHLEVGPHGRSGAASLRSGLQTDAAVTVWEHLVSTVMGHGASEASSRRPIDGAAPSLDAHVDITPIPVAPADVAAGRAALRAAGWDGRSRLLVVHPGAGGAAKQWPVEGFAEVIDPIDATIVVHEGLADAEAVRALAKHARRPIVQFAHPSLPTLAGALTLAHVYLGNDSGISHLASAVGTSAVALFTEPALPWIPWSPTARCLTVTTSRVVPAERAAIAAALAAAT